jgi:hypothetical protein
MKVYFPAFDSRWLFGISKNSDGSENDFPLWLKHVRAEVSRSFGHIHGIGGWLLHDPDLGYTDPNLPSLISQHPEFLPVPKSAEGGDDSQRLKPQAIVPPLSPVNMWQPCYSNPQLVTEVVSEIKKYFDQHPTQRGISIAVNDGGGYCHCQKCRIKAGLKPQDPPLSQKQRG